MRSSRDAFTLVELMVLVSILAIVMAASLPAIRATQLDARSLACKGRLHQLARGFHAYAHNHDGLAPTTELASTWDRILRPYIPTTLIYQCPADPHALPDGVHVSYTWRHDAAVPAPAASLAGQRLDRATPPDLALVWESSPNWHAPGRILIARLDASTDALTPDELAENLAEPVR